jgi:hypothetical protein
MTANFLIGVGGTGAKCVEAFTYLAAAGIGSAPTWVGLLDQDTSNGNTARTQKLLTDYVALRARLRAPGVMDLGGRCPLFGSALEAPRGGWTWAPQGRSGATLAGAAGYDGLPRPQQALMEALFTAEERAQPLDEGFRQRPALGAAMTLTSITADSQLWRDLLEALQASGHGVPVRVFLVASIFGGTGAAGLPTIARLLRSEIDRRDLADRVKLGAALLLPYFAFPLPPLDGVGIRPDSSAFMAQARGALEFYAALFRDRAVFDRLYVLGNDPLIQMREYADGGPTQANPPLFPELVAALAAVDFLHTRPEVAGETVMAATAPAATLGWGDLPYTGDGGPATLRRTLGGAVRFAMVWRAIYANALRGKGWRRCRHEAWFRRVFDDAAAAPPASDTVQAGLEGTQAFFDGMLRWLVGLSRMGAGEGRGLALLDAQRVAPGDAAIPELAAAIDARVLRGLVPGRSGPSPRQIFSHLTYRPLPRDALGMGRLLAGLHAACLEDTATGDEA